MNITAGKLLLFLLIISACTAGVSAEDTLGDQLLLSSPETLVCGRHTIGNLRQRSGKH